MAWLLLILLLLGISEAVAVVPTETAAVHLVYTSEVRGTVGICG